MSKRRKLKTMPFSRDRSNLSNRCSESLWSGRIDWTVFIFWKLYCATPAGRNLYKRWDHSVLCHYVWRIVKGTLQFFYWNAGIMSDKRWRCKGASRNKCSHVPQIQSWWWVAVVNTLESWLIQMNRSQLVKQTNCTSFSTLCQATASDRN